MLLYYFLQLEGIKGESRTAGHLHEIEVLSYSWQLQQAGIGYATGTAKGKMHFSDLLIAKKLDLASIPLALACAAGEHFAQARLQLCGNGEHPVLDILLTDVQVVSITHNGLNGDNTVTENVQLSYGKIEWKYARYDNKGNRLQSADGGFDVKKAVKV
jgi:type VI secretion system Hcp family effector